MPTFSNSNPKIKEIQMEILAIRGENINEKFINLKALIQVLNKDSSASSFWLNVPPPWLWQENQTDSVENFR